MLWDEVGMEYWVSRNKLIFALRPAVSEIMDIGGHLGFRDLEISVW